VRPMSLGGRWRLEPDPSSILEMVSFQLGQTMFLPGARHLQDIVRLKTWGNISKFCFQRLAKSAWHLGSYQKGIFVPNTTV
jgi:hypothetical protein